MFECEARVKAWGNSMGIVLPKKKIVEENISANQTVRVIVSYDKKLTVGDIFGKKKWKRPTSEIKAMLKNELDSKFFR